jgi:Leucine-rich repeat (LRR) protein
VANRLCVGEVFMSCLRVLAFVGLCVAVGACRPGPTPKSSTSIDEKKGDAVIKVSPEEAIAKLTALGAAIKRDSAGDVTQVTLRGDSIGDGDIGALASLPTITHLHLRDTQLTNRAVARLLDHLPKLRAIDLRGSTNGPCGAPSSGKLENLVMFKSDAPEMDVGTILEIADGKKLKVLALDKTSASDDGRWSEFSNLEELYLAHTKITDAALAKLGRLGKLKRLRISDNNINGAKLEELVGLTNLIDLDLSHTKVTDDSIEPLTRMPSVKKLNLFETPVTNAGVATLVRMPWLTWLNLDRTMITDACADDLLKLKNLEWLHLGGTAITDEGFLKLKQLKNLKTIIVTKTVVTDAAVETFRRAAPNCEIVHKLSDTQ